jgi:hypothetical protein
MVRIFVNTANAALVLVPLYNNNILSKFWTGACKQSKCNFRPTDILQIVTALCFEYVPPDCDPEPHGSRSHLNSQPHKLRSIT